MLKHLPGGCFMRLYTAMPSGREIEEATTEREEQLNLLHMDTLDAARSVQYSQSSYIVNE